MNNFAITGESVVSRRWFEAGEVCATAPERVAAVTPLDLAAVPPFPPSGTTSGTGAGGGLGREHALALAARQLGGQALQQIGQAQLPGHACHALRRLRLLADHGPTPEAFTFKQRFVDPDGEGAGLAVDSELGCPA